MTKRGPNHGYWNRRYRELQERDQSDGFAISRIDELQADLKYSMSRLAIDDL